MWDAFVIQTSHIMLCFNIIHRNDYESQQRMRSTRNSSFWKLHNTWLYTYFLFQDSRHYLRFDNVALRERWSFHLQLLSIDSLEVESEWNSSTTHDDTSATTAAIYRNQCFKNKSNTTFQYCIFIFFLWTYKYDTSTYAHILIQMSILNEKTYLPTCTYHEYFDINIFL